MAFGCALFGCWVLYLLIKVASDYCSCVMCMATLSLWASYQIRKISGCACTVNAGNVFPRHRFQRKPLVIDPDMHHGTCVKHVPWCMSGSITNDGGENVPGIPGACATRNFAYLVRGPFIPLILLLTLRIWSVLKVLASELQNKSLWLLCILHKSDDIINRVCY